MSVLVTGGAGYIGSHAVHRLLRDGQRVVALDNLFRGHPEAIDALQTIAGGRLTFIRGDVGDRDLVAKLLIDHKVKTVLHFAAMAYVGESVTQPLRYYRNNTAATLSLLEAIEQSWSDTRGGAAGGSQRAAARARRASISAAFAEGFTAPATVRPSTTTTAWTPSTGFPS